MARKQRRAPQKQNTPSIVPPQREPIRALTEKQERYLELLRNPKLPVVIATGAAGTGKTFLPTVLAADALMDGDIEKLIVTRPVIGVDSEELGFFPGDQNEKFGHWTLPVVEALEWRMGKKRVADAIRAGRIELAPLSTMRGRTFDNAYIILDEAQNTTEPQMEMFTTRLGRQSKTIITGDMGQTDIRKGVNGLKALTDTIYTFQAGIPILRFTEEECVRSEESKLFAQLWKKRREAANG